MLVKTMTINVLKWVKFVDKETIYFEGGLGSQLFSYLEFLRRVNATQSVLDQESEVLNHGPRCNLKYFQRPIGYEKNGLRIGPWLLDSYGVTMESMKVFEAEPRRGIKRIRSLSNTLPSTSLSTARMYRDYFRPKIDLVRFVEESIRLDYSVITSAADEFDCCSVHIRRGDFMAVASHIVSDFEYLSLLTSIRKVLPRHLVIFSDSKLSEKFKLTLTREFPKIEIRFCDDSEMDVIGSHEFMRRSKVLVTGNSMFSISAGMLTLCESLVFVPVSLYDEVETGDSANPFLPLGKFFVLNISTPESL